MNAQTRVAIGIMGRVIFWIGLVVIVGAAVSHSLDRGEHAMAIAEVIFFPATYVIYPWIGGLVWLFVISLVGYWLSTFIGGLEPVD